MWQNLIFSSNVIIADICGFCLASSHSPFFCSILLIFLWETTPPYCSAMWFRWILSLLPLQVWPITALYLLQLNWSKDMHVKSTSQANQTHSRDLCSYYWKICILCLHLLSKWHSSLERLVSIFAIARKESLWEWVRQRKTELRGWGKREKTSSCCEII